VLLIARNLRLILEVLAIPRPSYVDPAETFLMVLSSSGWKSCGSRSGVGRLAARSRYRLDSSLDTAFGVAGDVGTEEVKLLETKCRRIGIADSGVAGSRTSGRGLFEVYAPGVGG